MRSSPPAKDRTPAPCIGNSRAIPTEALGSPSNPLLSESSAHLRGISRPPARPRGALPPPGGRGGAAHPPGAASERPSGVPAARPAGTWGRAGASQGCASGLRGDFWTSWVLLREQPADTPPAVDYRLLTFKGETHCAWHSKAAG